MCLLTCPPLDLSCVQARCLDSGADDFITRPLQRDVLLSSLGMVFGDAQMGLALEGAHGMRAGLCVRVYVGGWVDVVCVWRGGRAHVCV